MNSLFKNTNLKITVLIFGSILIHPILTPSNAAAEPKKAPAMDVGGGFFRDQPSEDNSAGSTNERNQIRKDKYGADLGSSAPAEDPATDLKQDPSVVDGAINDTSDMFALPAQRANQGSPKKSDEEINAEKVLKEVRKKLGVDKPMPRDGYHF